MPGLLVSRLRSDHDLSAGLVASAVEVPVPVVELGPDDDDRSVAGHGHGGTPDVESRVGDVERLAPPSPGEAEELDLVPPPLGA